jgi:hypothetical protein
MGDSTHVPLTWSPLRRGTCARVALAVLCGLACHPAPRLAAQEAPEPVLRPAACASVVSSIDVENHDVFDATAATVQPIRWAMHLANALHARSRPGFVRRELLFREGDCLDATLLAESVRQLESRGFLARASVTTEDDGAGGVRVLVRTWDEWSTRADLGVTYDDGLNVEKFVLEEEHLLGMGILLQAAHRERLEERTRSFALATPTLPGRIRGSISFGQSRPGDFLAQGFSRPFAGDVGRLAVMQSVYWNTALFSYATAPSALDDAGSHSAQLLASIREERAAVGAAWRFGEPQASWILGASLSRDAYHEQGELRLAAAGDYRGGEPVAAELPPALSRQLSSTAAVRLGLHAGTRRYRYVTHEGLDGVRDVQTVGIGYFAGASLYPALGSPGQGTGSRLHASFGAAAGPLFLHGGSTLEGRAARGSVRDLLAEADAVAYLPFRAGVDQTLFLRLSAAGGWNTGMPFQLTLGGREGVRAYGDERFPGGRQLRAVLEDRIRLGWTAGGAIDLGATVFGDVGRVWPGDVPWGTDSGWRAAVGAGLRLGLPSGTRNVWRPDIVFPIGSGGGRPVFRLTYELNRMRNGFFNADLSRSRRFRVGPEHF